mgnify:CR=1 FL=1
MSAEYKFENHNSSEKFQELKDNSKVKLTDLLFRLNEEKKKDDNIVDADYEEVKD